MDTTPIQRTLNFVKKDVVLSKDDIYDISYPLKDRINFIVTLLSTNSDQAYEIIDQICGIYEMYPTVDTENLLESMKDINIMVEIKYKIAHLMFDLDEDKSKSYNVFSAVLDDPTLDKNKIFSVINILLMSKVYYDKAVTKLNEYLFDNTINSYIKYKSFSFIDKNSKLIDQEKLNLLLPLSLKIMRCVDYEILYRTLAAQYYLVKSNSIKERKGPVKLTIDIDETEDEKEKEVDPNQREAINFCLDTGRNKDIEYNRRADAIDIVLQTGNKQDKLEARQIILELAENTRNVFENKQNVHFVDIGPVMEVIIKTPINFQNLEAVILEIEKLTSQNEIDAVARSLDRILLDRLKYGKEKKDSSAILLHIWSYITNQIEKDEMKKRLIEELVDMDSTCSSGHVNRLINTVSGFGDLSVRITFEQQIASNLAGRLNAILRKMEDQDRKMDILCEMRADLPLCEKIKYIQFYREHINDIIKELHSEFVDEGYITDDNFVEYIRSATMAYELGEK